MKKSHALVVLVVLGAVVVLLMRSQFEPRYQGKGISVWISQLDAADPARRQEAKTAIQQLGAEGRSWMVRRLNREESGLEKILRGDRSSGLLTAYDIKRARMATALGSLGPAAAPAIPALERATGHVHWLIAARAQAALMQIRREPAVPLLDSLTNTTEIGAWLRSACVLSALGTNPDVSVLVATVRKDLRRAFETVQLFCTNHVDPAISRPILLACLQHKEAGVRANTLNGMIIQRSWGDAERDAIVQCISDPDPGVRCNAMFALNCFPKERLNAASSNLMQALLGAANHPDPTVRAFALELLGKVRHRQ
jgi:hypothetical protein